MHIDRYSKIVLTVIAAALAVIAVRAFGPEAAVAQGTPGYQVSTGDPDWAYVVGGAGELWACTPTNCQRLELP